jgi:hypothetical protein
VGPYECFIALNHGVRLLDIWVTRILDSSKTRNRVWGRGMGVLSRCDASCVIWHAPYAGVRAELAQRISSDGTTSCCLHYCHAATSKPCPRCFEITGCMRDHMLHMILGEPSPLGTTHPSLCLNLEPSTGDMPSFALMIHVTPDEILWQQVQRRREAATGRFMQCHE